MVLIREFEQAIHRLFLKGEVHGTTHLSAGQEAVPVGVCMALDADDYVSGTYRGHGHALAKGTAPEALAAEMLGRASGVCGGRAGSMNVVDLEHGLVGCFGIVGGSIAAATGAALSARRQGRVSVAFFGDGATNQAYFHECLNFARVLRAAGRLRVREQLLRRVHADGERHRGRRDRRPRGRLQDPLHGRRRQRSLGCARRRFRGGRARAVRGRPDAARVPDLPPLRALEVRSREVPARRRARALVGARPARRSPASACSRTGSARTRSPRSRPRPGSEMERATQAALAAPYPDPRERPGSEFRG